MNTHNKAEDFGTLIEPTTLKIERMLPGPIERVWSYLTDNDLRSQVSSRQYTVQSDRRIKLQSKDDMRKAGRKSPDHADALAMTFVLDWQGEGAHITAGSDMDAEHAPFPGQQKDLVYERDTASLVGNTRGTDMSPWSPSRWKRNGH